MKPRKVYVSDGSVKMALECKEERWLVGEGLGYYWCLGRGEPEKLYEWNGEISSTVRWAYIAEIPEKKTRPMTGAELVVFAVEHPDCVIKMKRADIIFTPYAIDSNDNPEFYLYAHVKDGKIGEWMELPEVDE
jgi:hypothetical protein